MKIGLKLTILFLIMAFVPMIFLGLVMLNQIESNIRTISINNLEIAADLLKQNILHTVDRNYERIKGVASRTQLRVNLREYTKQAHPDIKQKMVKIITHAKEAIDDFEAIYIYDLKGEVVASTDKDNYYKDLLGDKNFLRDQKREYFAVKRDSQGHFYIILAAPLNLDNEKIGFCVVIANYDSIASVVLNYEHLGKTGDILLAKRNEEGYAEFIAPRRYEADEDALEIVTKDKINVPITQSLLKNESVFLDSIDYRGVPVISVTKYIEPVDWGLVTKIDQREILDQLAVIKTTIFIFATVIFIFTIFMGFVISRSISNPIEKLEREARKISEGNLEFEIDQEVLELDDELGSLSRAVAKMTKDLIKSNVSLDVQVQERTKELNKRMEHLERLNDTMVGREKKMIELKKEVELLKKDLKSKG